MDLAQLCIATISWARDEGEEKLLRESLNHLARLNVPIFVTDGGSPDSFLQYLRSLPQVTLLSAATKGVFYQAQNSVQAAYEHGAQWILYTEPDKVDLFATLPDMLQEQIQMRSDSGVCLLSRSAAAFATFPSFQQMTETAINCCCRELVGLDVDYTYGPFVFNRVLSPTLESIRENLGWGWRPYLFTMAKSMGLQVRSVETGVACPHDQRKDSPSERIYRMKQLEQNIRGLVLASQEGGINS
jgi:hypothetical protein